MKKPSDNSNKFWQVLILRGVWRKRALSWPGINQLLVIKPPIIDPNVLTIFGAGTYFEPFEREEAYCFCLNECPESPDNSDLSQLIKHLRMGDA